MAMTVRRAQPKTPSTFQRHESRTEFLVASQIHPFCVLQTLEAMLSKQGALGAEVGPSVSPWSCAGALLILQELPGGTCGPNIMLVHRDCCFLCNSETVIQLSCDQQRSDK